MYTGLILPGWIITQLADIARTYEGIRDMALWVVRRKALVHINENKC